MLHLSSLTAAVHDNLYYLHIGTLILLYPTLELLHRKQEIFSGDKIGKFGESWAFAKFFLANIHRYTETVYLAYMHWLAYPPNFSSPIAITCTVRQIFSRQIFPVYGILKIYEVILLKSLIVIMFSPFIIIVPVIQDHISFAFHGFHGFNLSRESFTTKVHLTTHSYTSACTTSWPSVKV